MPALLFAENSTFLRFGVLTEEETRIFRPDLPMRLARTSELNWNSFSAVDFQSFQTVIQPGIKSQKLHTDRVVLIPYGNKGGFKKGTMITAENGKFFEGDELIWKAKMLQENANNQVSQGIGLFRMGFEKDVPSYYIGEYFDRAGLLKA
jgi:hypothetical protein